jgi:hypothetical protein
LAAFFDSGQDGCPTESTKFPLQILFYRNGIEPAHNGIELMGLIGRIDHLALRRSERRPLGFTHEMLPNPDYRDRIE